MKMSVIKTFELTDNEVGDALVRYVKEFLSYMPKGIPTVSYHAPGHPELNIEEIEADVIFREDT